MAKLGWPKGGFDTFTAIKPWSSSTSRAPASESLERLQDFPREPGELKLGGTGLFLQLLRFHSHDQMSHRGGVPPWSPSPQLPFCTLCAGLDNLPPPPLPSSRRFPSTHCKIPLCASELIACELGDGFLLTPHPKGCRAALKSPEIGTTHEPRGQR